MELFIIGSLILKKFLRIKLDVIQLGSNVFFRFLERSRFVWKSSKLLVFDIMQFFGEINLFLKFKIQRFIDSFKEEFFNGFLKYLMFDLLQNFSSSQSFRSKRWKRFLFIVIVIVFSSQYYSIYISKLFFLLEQV